MKIVYNDAPMGHEPLIRRQTVLSDDEWSRDKRETVRLLRSRNCGQQAGLLENHATQLLDTKVERYNDACCTLYILLPLAEYSRIVDAPMYVNKHFFDNVVNALNEVVPVRVVAVALHFVAEDEVTAPDPKTLKQSSEAVQHALKDAALLIREHGASRAIDRIHTAFHSHLQDIASTAGLPVAKDGITAVFKVLREQHPAIAAIQKDRRIGRIVSSMAAIIDAVNELRNNDSPAHPNPVLGELEAVLVIDSVKALMPYIDARAAQVGNTRSSDS